MTKTYAMIDLHTGFVWGVETARDAVSACRQMDEAIGIHGRSYDEGSASDLRCGLDAYAVHEAPAGFDVTDGQDADQIAAVEMLPRVTFVLVSESGA